MVMNFFKSGPPEKTGIEAYLGGSMGHNRSPLYRVPHLAWISVFLMSAQATHSQGCNTMPPAADFKVETLSTDVPGNAMDIDVARDLKVYWVERYGNFKVYDPSTKATRLIKHFDV